MPTTLPTRRYDWKKIVLRAAGLLLFIGGISEMVYVSDRPTVSEEEELPTAQETVVTTPTGDQIKVISSSMVSVRVNPILILGGVQTVIGLVLLWLARERRPASPSKPAGVRK